MPSRPWSMPAESCMEQLGVQKDRGLSSGEAGKRLAAFGKNSLPAKKRKWIGTVFLEQFFNPLVGLLLVSGGIIMWMGNLGDACVVWVVVLVNAIMGTIQEGRAERSIAALRKLTAHRARVLRNGAECICVASDLVPGDIVLLAAGDAVPADMRIIEAAGVEAVEAVLTGESFPVVKGSAPLISAEVVNDQTNMLFSGTYLTKGRCLGVVTATGLKTEIGKIAALVGTTPEPKTPIEQKIAEFGRQLIIAAIVIFIVFFGVGFWREMPINDIFLAAVSQLVSIIPEGLPVAITIALAVGVQRMAKHGAVIRRIYAVETLGSTTAICSDKTGTLTKNEMTVVEISLCAEEILDVEGVGYDPAGSFYRTKQKVAPLEEPTLKMLLEACALCNDANLIMKEGKWTPIGEPMEAALISLCKKAGLDVEQCRASHPRLSEIPFDSSHKMMATYHNGFTFVKGAMEEVLALCSKAYETGEPVPLSDNMKKQIEYEAHLAASEGRRILGFACFRDGFSAETGFESLKGKGEWLGFAALIDPPREGVLEAVALCRKAHIRPVMMTGDHLTTAKAIAEKLGILREHDIAIDGKALSALTEREFNEKCHRISVYARLQPEQKYHVVQVLQSRGEVVAVTGDGVNDAPALAKADVGVAMGSGTDVAKEAARIILTDDNFATLVHAVEQGRLVYRNIVKVVVYLLSTTFAAAFVMVLAVTLGYPLPMAAVQVLWINVVTEGTVTINLVLDPPDGTEMDSPPLRKTDHILSRSNLLGLGWTILIIGGLLFGQFLYSHSESHPLEVTQTKVFTLLAFCAWFKLLSSRSSTRSALTLDFLKNIYLAAGLALSVLLQAAVIYHKELNVIFHTVPLSVDEVLRLLALGSIVLWTDEIIKWYKRRKR